MHFNLKRAVGVMAIPMLGSALAVGAAALPANATTWQDTALSAYNWSPSSSPVGTPVATDTAVISPAVSTTITLSGVSGATWRLHAPPLGVSLVGAVISWSGSAVANATPIVADAIVGGNAVALSIPVTIGADSVQTSGNQSAYAMSALSLTNAGGTVMFGITTLNPVSYAESSLPTGLAQGNPLTYVGGNAAPGTYGPVTVTATDTDGAMLTGTFLLTVQANSAYTIGDEVNPSGNGFDVYRQQQAAGAMITGWPATQADPATQFMLLAGTHSGAVKFEYAPSGTGTGLCISDPDGGWASDPLPDGLILTGCNNGLYQQFVPQSNGTLENVKTGLFVNPAGTGRQLRDASTTTTWGGSVYSWTDYTSLPAA